MNTQSETVDSFGGGGGGKGATVEKEEEEEDEDDEEDKEVEEEEDGRTILKVPVFSPSVSCLQRGDPVK